MENAYLFVKRVTGEDFVYPGHPLVIATLIMMGFDDFDSANKPTSHGSSEALADNRIPGARCHVGASMHMLRLGAEGSSIDDLVAYAKDYWDRGQAGGHVKYVEPGRKQAAAIEPHFRELAAKWFAKKMEPKKEAPAKTKAKRKPVEHHRRIKLRGGIEFDVVFVKRSNSLIVVHAEDRAPMRVRHVQMHGHMTWAARVDGRGLTAYHVNPAKAFETAARLSWRKPSVD